MTDYGDSPTFKLYRKLMDEYYSAFPDKIFEKDYTGYAKLLEEYKEKCKMFPSPEYLDYDNLEVGKIYHIASGLNHPSIKIHEKNITEQGVFSYVYSLVKLSIDRPDVPDTEYTARYKTGTINQMFARYKEGAWQNAEIIEV